MKRIYRLNGQIVDLNAIMEHLQDLLGNNGNTEMWANFGIDFEDTDFNYAVEYSSSINMQEDKQYFETLDEAKKCFEQEKAITLKDHNDWKIADNYSDLFTLQQNTTPFDYIQIRLVEL